MAILDHNTRGELAAKVERLQQEKASYGHAHCILQITRLREALKDAISAALGPAPISVEHLNKWEEALKGSE